MFSFDESRLPRQQPKVSLPPGQRLATQIPEDDDELVPLLDRADWKLPLTPE